MEMHALPSPLALSRSTPRQYSAEAAEKQLHRTIRREDPDHGSQQIGRVLSRRHNVRWDEYWAFLAQMFVINWLSDFIALNDVLIQD